MGLPGSLSSTAGQTVVVVPVDRYRRNPGHPSVTCPDAGAVQRGKSLSSSVGWGFVQSSGQSYQSHESIKYMADHEVGHDGWDAGFSTKSIKGYNTLELREVSLDI